MKITKIFAGVSISFSVSLRHAHNSVYEKKFMLCIKNYTRLHCSSCTNVYGFDRTQYL